ncbi:terpene synthase family protein [Yinghuangia sp. YIM S09857]|uniref:terpene synthase family protein n=1 Tax=Yinghuangia sp. YIM S09857 TaxID=3436929 RepID=UPI003F52A460
MDLRIPPLWCPLELHVGDGAEEYQERSYAWLARHRLDERSLLRAAATDTGFLACTWAPQGTREGVQLLSDWLIWALLFDDYYCDSGRLADQPAPFNTLIAQMMARALYPELGGTGDPAFDAFASALADLVARIRSQADPQVAHLCSAAHYQWAVGAMCGVGDRAAGTLRSAAQHLLIRPSDGAAELSALMIEVAEGTALSARERVTPQVRAFGQAAGILLTVPTDLASYRHEEHQGCLESNLVRILGVELDCPPQVAVDRTCAVLENTMEFFVAMRERLLASGRSDLRRYADQLANMVRGTYEWQRFLPRYTTVLDVPAESRSLSVPRPEKGIHEIVDRRTRSDHPEAAVPLISWWWDLL